MATFRLNTELLYQTDPIWVEKVEENFHLFLADHAANERKAAASAMLLVVQYPDRLSLVDVAAKIAEEEIAHFRQVFRKMKKMGAPLLPDVKDEYARKLHSHVRSAGDGRLMDRLLVHALFELRGLERFSLLANHLAEKEWRDFYDEISKSEVGHSAAFLSEAMKIFEAAAVEDRWNLFLKLEAQAIKANSVTWKFH